MNIAQIKVWLILLLSTFILLIGIVFSIFLSSLYLSPLGQNYAKKELNKVNKIVENDYSILKEVFKDFTISNEEKIIIDNLNIVKNNSGNIKFIIQERDRKTKTRTSNLDIYNHRPTRTPGSLFFYYLLFYNSTYNYIFYKNNTRKSTFNMIHF